MTQSPLSLKMQKNNKFIKDWILIFKLEEIHELLSYKELKNLSLVCKQIYHKTKPLLVSQIHLSLPMLFRNLANNGGIKFQNDLLFIFKESVKSISNYVTLVKIRQPPLYPELYLYLDIFKNLEGLHFYYSQTKINLSSMNLILNRLQNLKTLSLTGLTIYSDEKENTNKLLIPATLAKLSITQCHWPDYYKIIAENSLATPALGPYSAVSTQKFPQLISFRYISSRSHLNFNPINLILKNSPKLEILDTEVKFLDQETFTLISESRKLKSINLNNLNGDVNFKGFSLPSYLTISWMSYNFIKNTSRTLLDVEFLLFHFPNLTHLNLSYKKPFLPYLKRILKKSTKLQQLKLINSHIGYIPLPVKLINRTVAHLILVNFKLGQVDFEDFVKWYSLKTVKLEVDDSFIAAEEFIKEGKNLKKIKICSNWKAFNYSDCIKFYKITK